MIERQAKLLYENFMRKTFRIDNRIKAAQKGMDTDAFSENNIDTVKANIISAIEKCNIKILPKLKNDKMLQKQINLIIFNINESNNLFNEISEYLYEYVNSFVRVYID